MRIAVLSDVHGNLPALEAVLEALKPYDAVWQLGDVVGYGPQPDEVVARLAAEKAIGVRGNHDSAAIGLLDTDAFNDDARAAVEWTREHIEPATRKWLAALPLRSIDDPFTLVHGSPARSDVGIRLQHVNRARRTCPISTPITAWSATLTSRSFFASASRAAWRRRSSRRKRPMKLGGARSIVNPGSVGQPRDGDPRACAMILDTDENSVEWRRVEYPIERVQKLMKDARLPPRLISRLQFGL